MTLSMIVRTDDGGLGNLTWEWFRHLAPAKVMLVLDGGRGGDHLERFGGPAEVRGVNIQAMRWAPHDVDWLLDGATQLLTAETFYDDRLISLAVRRNVRPVLYAMPELFTPMYRTVRGLSVLAPTTWETDRLGGKARVLPLPVDRERLRYRLRTEARTILHPSAGAMLDRNGTGLLRQALMHVTRPLTVLVSGPERPDAPTRHGPHTIKPVGHVAHYWRCYDDADVLVMPRRYGGLSMPMQEALACGVPIVTLDREPECQWTALRSSTRGGPEQTFHMKGGDIPVVTGDAMSLALVLSQLTENDDEVRAASVDADVWAAKRSWTSAVGDEWRALA